MPGSFLRAATPAYASEAASSSRGRLAPWLLQAAARGPPSPLAASTLACASRPWAWPPGPHKELPAAWPADRTARPCAFRSLLLVRPLSPQDSIRLWKQLLGPWAPVLSPGGGSGEGRASGQPLRGEEGGPGMEAT